MANDDHVALLKKDADAWNRWRGENPNVLGASERQWPLPTLLWAPIAAC